MKKLILVLSLILCIFYPPTVLAHPGRLDKNNCHTCKTNCAKWGLDDYEYHCHNGNTYTNKNGQTYKSDGSILTENNKNMDASNNDNNISSSDDSLNNNVSDTNDNSNNNINNTDVNSNTNNNKESSNKNNSSVYKDEKSADNTLKSITIDGKVYTELDNIIHNTSKEKVNIEVITRHAKATYNIKNSEHLIEENNSILIVVTAENGSTKTYNIIIKKERILSSETGIDLTINNEKVIFQNYESTVHVDSSVEELDISYILKDKNAKIEMDKIDDLMPGDNYLAIKVIAEDGTEQEYKITIHKSTQTEDAIYTTIGLGIIGGSGYGIYKLKKKKR